MRFTVQRDALADAVTWVARALPTRPVIPVLTGLLLQASDGQLTIACFDYEVSARMAVAAEVGEPGTALVPGRLLLEITRSLPGLPVEFRDDPDGVLLECGEASFTLVTLPHDDYPELPGVPRLAGTVDGGALGVAIGQVTPAASRDDTLPLLTAVNLELAAETMTLAATDRYRMAVRELGWESAWSPDGGSEEAVAVLVPARILADAARMMSVGTPVRIMLSDAADSAEAMVGFESGGRRLTTRLLAGEFIKYRSRFPAGFDCVADLPAEAFTEAVRRVSLVAERGTPVQLSFGPGQVTMVAATQGQARARETLRARFSGDVPAIAFNPHYLLDGLVAAAAAGAAGTGEEPEEAEAAAPVRVRLQFSGPSKPAVVTPCTASGEEAMEDSFRYLVVPQRVPQ
jgi:DNA polymerase-3 subunit beta